MNIQISKNQEVDANPNYITCQEGLFDANEYVLCKEKTDTKDNTVMFLASQIKSNT